MSDWKFAQGDPKEQLARLHFFSMNKVQADGVFEFRITVKEFYTPRDPSMPFFAQADKQTNQKQAPYTPTGWGKTLFEALLECMKEINRFPHQP